MKWILCKTEYRISRRGELTEKDKKMNDLPEEKSNDLSWGKKGENSRHDDRERKSVKILLKQRKK